MKQDGGGGGSEEGHEYEMLFAVQRHQPPSAASPDGGCYEDVAISPCALYSDVPAVSLPIQPQSTDGGRPSAEADFVCISGDQ